MHYKKREWTVFFLIRSVGPNITHLIRLVNEIRSIPMAAAPAIVFCLKMLQENRRALECGDTGLMTTDDAPATVTTLFYILADDPQGDQFVNRLAYIDEKPDFDFSDPVYLEGYFREVILKPFKARHYLLITFDHGNAFGIFPKEIIDNSGQQKVLYMEELNRAIRFALQGKKIDVVMMVNCYMQSVMSGIALHRSVKYLVAPESYMDFSGYNYASIFHLIANRKNLKGRALAKHAITSFPEKVYTKYTTGVGNKNQTAVFATRLSRYHLLPRLIDQLVDALVGLDPFPYTSIMDLQKTLLFSKYDDLVDLYIFTRMLVKENFFKNCTHVPGILLALQEMIVQQQFIGDQLSEAEPVLYSGLSIYFPGFVPPPGEWGKFDRFKQFVDSDLYKTTKWKDFLLKLYYEQGQIEKTDLVNKVPDQF
jgi:hypothetical protein